MVEPLISVIIPIFNVSKYLAKCIDSVLLQTYTNIEVVLIDDGSTDDSFLICKSYARKDRRITIIHQNNAGLSSARNSGLDVAIGDYICFVDSDDYISPFFVEKLYYAIIKNDADVSMCGFVKVDEDGNGLFIDEPPLNTEVIDKQAFFEKLEDKYGYRYVVTWNKLYSRKVIGKYRFPEGKIHEDEATTHLFINNCRKIVIINEQLYYYVSRQDSIMGQSFSIKRLDCVEAWISRGYYYLSSNYYHCLDILIVRLLSFYYLRRRMFVKGNKIRIAELDIKCKRFIKDSKKCISSRKTKIYVLVASHFPYILSLRHSPLFALVRKIIVFKNSKQLKSTFKRKIESSNSSTKNISIFLLDTPRHGNLGDQAICESEKQILMSSFPNYLFYEHTYDEWCLCKKTILKKIKDQDLVFLPGGGFIGSLWPNEHKNIVDIIKKTKHNKVIVFPQTIFFDAKDLKVKQIFINVCLKSNNLLIMVRDKNSYENMVLMGLASKCKYVPDTVLAYNYHTNFKKHNGKLLLCMRKDKEKAIDNYYIEKLLVSNGFHFDRSSTVLNQSFDSSNRREFIDKEINEFAQYSLVITDRLHAMVFSLLAGTPCIAFDNSSKKVSGVYDWVKDVKGITCISPDKLTKNLIDEYASLGPIDFNPAPYTEIIKKTIMEFVDGEN